MILWVNKVQQEYPDVLSLFELLEQLQKVHQSGIAVAVNNCVIPKKDWAKQRLENKDSITIITATQGG